MWVGVDQAGPGRAGDAQRTREQPSWVAWPCCGLCDVEVPALYTCFSKRFYHQCMLNCVKCFFCISCDDRMIFTLCFVNVVHHMGYFAADVNPPPHLWDESHLIMVHDLSVLLKMADTSFCCNKAPCLTHRVTSCYFWEPRQVWFLPVALGVARIEEGIYLKMKRSLKILRGSDSMVCGRLDVTL